MVELKWLCLAYLKDGKVMSETIDLNDCPGLKSEVLSFMHQHDVDNPEHLVISVAEKPCKYNVLSGGTDEREA